MPEEPATTPIPYEHDPVLVDAGVALMDTAYAEAPRFGLADYIANQYHVHGLEPDSPVVRELVYVVSYVLRLPFGSDVGCDLEPADNSETRPWPPRMADVAGPVIELWRDLAANVTHPAAQARLFDLLFIRRDGNGRQRALAAINGYIAATPTRPSLDLEVAQYLVRAWNLARQIGDLPSEETVRKEMVVRINTAIVTGPVAAGTVLSMLAAVATPPRKPKKAAQSPASGGISGATAQDTEIDATLAAAVSTYTDSHIVSMITSWMRARATDPKEVERINRREVQAYLDEAGAAQGFLSQHRLRAAISVATRHGLNDLVQDATARMQKMAPSDLGFSEVSSSVQLPRSHVERWLARFTESGDWRMGLALFLATSCPSGELEDLQRAQQEMARQSVMMSMISVTIVTDEGLPKWTTTSDEDREAHGLAVVASARAECEGGVLAVCLQRIAGRYGVPSEGDLTAFLSSDGEMDQVLCRTLARAFRHFWSGDYEACVHVAVPKIEAACRALLRELDEGIYRIQVGQSQGGYVGLYNLLRELRALALDESWEYFLRWLLIDTAGPNIRNDVAHGLVTKMGPTYAALVLRAASLLIPLVAPQPEPVGVGMGQTQGSLVGLAATAAPRERQALLRLLSRPVPDPYEVPWRRGLVPHLAQRSARVLTIIAHGLLTIARKLN